MINAHPILGCIEIKRKKVKSGRHEKWYNRKREERCIETTAEEVLDSVFVTNRTDDELISSIATCKMNKKNIS